MIIVLANLSVGCNNSDVDKPFFLKEAMLSSYWKDFKKAMYVKFQSFIKNDTWEYRNVLSSRAVLTGY